MRITVRQAFNITFDAPGVGSCPKHEYRAFEKIRQAYGEALSEIKAGDGIEIEKDGDGAIADGPDCMIDWQI